jgi:hypothetical protein
MPSHIKSLPAVIAPFPAAIILNTYTHSWALTGLILCGIQLLWWTLRAALRRIEWLPPQPGPPHPAGPGIHVNNITAVWQEHFGGDCAE